MKKQKIKAATYHRIATLEQNPTLDSQNHIRVVSDFLRKNDSYTHCATYIDIGVSGTIPLGNRPEGAGLLQDAREGRFEVVLVTDLNRLGRSFEVLINSVNMLSGTGVKLRSILEPYNTETPEGKMMFNMMRSIAEFEVDMNKERNRKKDQ